MKNKIFYISDYSDHNSYNRKSSPASSNKVMYISEILAELGYNVEIVSSSKSDKKFVFGRINQVANKIKVKYFTSFPWFGIFKIVRIFMGNSLMYFYLLFRVKKEDIVIIYHSVIYYKIFKMLRFFKRKNIILELEEVYSDINDFSYRKSKRENEIIKNSTAYIFANDYLKGIYSKNKHDLVVYGIYKSNYQENDREGKCIRLVYAGTFSQKKGGVYKALELSKYLDSNYELKILGFGSRSEIEQVTSMIDNLNDTNDCKIEFIGLLKGSEYAKFMSRCDIGLSTQNSGDAFNITSFPSKVLDYMSYNLDVVSTKVEPLVNSKLSSYVYITDDDPYSIAQTIKIASASSMDSKKLIKQLNSELKIDLKRLIENVKSKRN